jgi:hypothetical protein
MVRIGAAIVIGGALSASAMADPAPIVPVTADVPLLEIPSLTSASDVSVPVGDALPAPVASETAGTVIPLPPGVYMGLVGLASAAIARRRYLKRH